MTKDCWRSSGDNQEKFDRAAAQAKQTLGRDAAVLDDLLKDKDRLRQLFEVRIQRGSG